MTCLSLLEITWKETSLKSKRAKAFNELENDVLTFNQLSHCPLSYFGRALSIAEVRGVFRSRCLGTSSLDGPLPSRTRCSGIFDFS